MSKLLNIKQLVLLVITLYLLITSAVAWSDEQGPYPRILVTGQGSVDLVPDMAVLALTVRREAETAHDALEASSSAMHDVLTAMKAEGIEPRDLQTSGFSIQPKYSRPSPKSSTSSETPRIIAYTVRNGLTVRVRDISALGRILDKSVRLGVNEGGSFVLSNEDPSAAITQARIKAMKDAISKAKTLAKAAGVKTGKLLEVSEQSFSPRPMPMARAEMTMLRSAKAVPVAIGENTYKVTVNVSFAIEQ